jgi:hypothetical protein
MVGIVTLLVIESGLNKACGNKYSNEPLSSVGMMNALAPIASDYREFLGRSVKGHAKSL